MILPYSHSLSVQSVARNGYGYIDNAEVEVLWAMTKAVGLLRQIHYRKGACAIDKPIKTTENKQNVGGRGKTKVIVKEHFSEKGKTVEELLTDVLIEKAKRTIA